MRVVLDSNVYISALKFRGKPLDLVTAGIDGYIRIYLSPSIINETLRVLQVKFHAPPFELSAAQQTMAASGKVIEPSISLNAVLADSDDNHVVELAVAAGVDAIITGDNHLLQMREYQGIEMMRVAVALRKLRQSTD